MCERVVVTLGLVAFLCVGVTRAEEQLTTDQPPVAVAAVAVTATAPMAPAPLRTLVLDDVQARAGDPRVLRRDDLVATPWRGGPLVALEVDPVSGEVRVLEPFYAGGITQEKAVVDSSFDVVSAGCVGCGTGCPEPTTVRSVAALLEANVSIPAGYGVSDLTAGNFAVSSVVQSTNAALGVGGQVLVTITGDVVDCGSTFRVYFSMCDTPPLDPTLGCTGGGGVPTFVGSFRVTDGVHWTTNPPTYTCREACNLLFGGVESDYRCSVDPSTDPSSITGTAWLDGWGALDRCGAYGGTPAADDWKVNSFYDCGFSSCSYSAYVNDHSCASVNYCWLIP